MLVLGGALTFDAMVERTGTPRDDEAGDGWAASESSRFGRYARRLWDGLLAHGGGRRPMTTAATKSDRVVMPESFNVSGALPRGMTLLQASAGTGKTFTIAALTTRYVAEGLPIDRLLVITFTRMATGELRERVRDRLVRAFDGLAAALAGITPTDDEIVRHLADAPEAEVERRRGRLGKAIADFDSATIETTHGFCLQVLYGLGTVRRRRPGGDPGRGRERPHGRGGGRPLPAALRQQAKRIRLLAGCGNGNRNARSCISRTHESCRTCRQGKTCRPSAGALPRRCVRRWIAGSEHSRSSPTTMC